MRLTGIFFLVILSMNGYAQQNGIVKGNVTDTLLHKGLAYTTISLVKQKDSTLISFSRADSSGNFKINNIAAGNYLLSFSYVGYMPVWKPIHVKAGELLDLGAVILTDLIHTNSVTVNARRAPITINNDTVEFNTENFKTPPNAVVEDLLKRLPGVTVDKDGTVSVNGQKINKLFVNGKEFFTGDPKMATKNLDADAVDKVQVFDRKSDRAEFTGIDDGQTSKAINLKLKKDRNNSTFGRITAGAGDKERYDGQTNINRFKGDKQMSLIGMGNNTNRQGFSISDVMNFSGDLARGLRNGGGVNIRINNGEDDGGLPVSGGGQNQQGVATTFAGGLNYNNNWNKKTDLNLNGVASDVNLLTNTDIFRQNLLPGNSFNYFSNGSNIKHNKQQRLGVTLDQKIDSFASIRFTPQFTIQQNENSTNSSYYSDDVKGGRLNEGTRLSTALSNAFNFSGNLLYRQRFRKKGRTISSTTNMNLNNSTQNGTLQTSNRFYNAGVAMPDSVVKQVNSRNAFTNNFGTNIVYTEPIGKKSLLEFSSFYSINKGDSKRETFDYNSSNSKYDKFNSTLSNNFTSRYSYAGGGIAFRSNFKKFSVTTGANLQVAELESINNTNGNKISQSFTDWLPSAVVQLKRNATSTINLTYNTSTTQPSTFQLQPVTDISDPLNVYTGNPSLQRSYTHTVSLSYFATNIYSQKNLFAFINYANIRNGFGTEDIVLANGARQSRPVNVDGNFTLFGNINAGFPIKKLKSRIDVGMGYSFFRTNGVLNTQNNRIDNQGFTPNINYSFALDSIVDIMLTARVSKNLVSYQLQPQLNNTYYQQTYGIETTNYLPAGFVMTNSYSLTLNTGRADGYNTPISLWNISLAKSFLKYKRGELKFSALDVLNQNQGINRTANQNFVQDTRYNVLQRYFLLSFSYRLHKANGNGGARVVIRNF